MAKMKFPTQFESAVNIAGKNNIPKEIWNPAKCDGVCL